MAIFLKYYMITIVHYFTLISYWLGYCKQFQK